MSNKKFTLQFDFEGNIGPIKSSVEQLQKSLKGIKLPDNIGTGLDKTFSRLAAEFENFEAIVKTGFDDLGNVSKAEKSFGKISTLINQLSIQAGSIQGIDPKKLIPQESLDRLKGLEKAWADVKKESEKKTNLDKEIDKQTSEIEEQEKAIKKLTDAHKKLAAESKALGSQKGAKTNSKNAKERERAAIVSQMTALEGQKGGKSSIEYKNLSQSYSQLSQSIRSLETDIRKIDSEINNNKVEMAGLETQINSNTEAYEKMKAQLTNLKNTQIAPKGLVELRTELAKLTGANIESIPQDLEELQKIINGLTDKELEAISKALTDIKTDADNLSPPLTNAKTGVENLGEAGKEIARTANEMENLKRQVMDFFSITNSIQLLKRAVTGAMNTIKELDATMTEAAVVTEFDIGDMWEQLPTYSKNAQDLGVSINGMYQATTLYYQQGLKNNEAMQLGVETMKMAKIAGIDSAEATKAMTAALRGFNMELNEMSATRVNDVYSQLAAVTAADTEQIATAMEKTASIAASANMEFETTAALLAQIIETTQEAPETAGTAMKTIIARFAEVKSLRDQGLTSGEDEEGEIIDVNKIQTALRSVGISMEGFFSGTEGLDSVLLKLAEKWGSLDFETQRYIATMAAGSRQQSRFIAMMSDYKRTTELVGEAQNSAGASQKQFEKTTESLETSLIRLENAWNEFLMGLANENILKGAVNALTKFLETINKITETLSGGDGLKKSIVSLVGVLGTLAGGKSLLSGTALGGSILSRFTGGAEGGKTSIWARPGEIAAQRREARSQRPALFKKTVLAATYTDKDKSNLQRRIGLAATNAEKKGSGEAAQLRALHEEIKKGSVGVEEASKKFGELGGNIEGLGQASQKIVPNFDAMGQAATTAGAAMMGAGAATSLLASAFESWGMEEEAEAMQTLSGVLITFGSILMGIGSFLPTLTGLTAAQAAATWAALWPVLLIVAALAALVAVIVLVAKHQHEISLEGRMEAAAEATERAKEAAEAAEEAYDNLLSNKSKYGELQNELDNLTKGTLEWQRALADSNAQVLELLDKYPELVQYLTRGKHGELEISAEGWNRVEQQQLQAIQNAQGHLIASQMAEIQLKIEGESASLGDLSDLRDDAYHAGLTKKVTEDGITRDTLDQAKLDLLIGEFLKSEDDFFSDEQLQKLSTTLGISTEAIEDLEYNLRFYAESLKEDGNNPRIAEYNLQLQAQSQALLSNYASKETLASEFGGQIISGFSAGYTGAAAKAKAAEVMINLNTDGKLIESDYFKKLMAENFISSSQMTGNNVHDLEQLYAAMRGITTDQIEDGIKGNLEELKKKISEIQAAKDTGTQIDEVYQKMSQLDTNTQRNYGVLMSKEVSGANDAFIQKFMGTEVTELEAMASDLGLTLDELMANLGYKSIKEMQTAFELIASEAQKTFKNIKDQAKKNNIDISQDALQNATASQLQTYVDMMSYSMVVGGKGALQRGFDEIFTRATEEQEGKITSLIDSFDWTREGSGKEFLEQLRLIDPKLADTAEGVEGFTSALDQVNAIFRSFSLSETIDKIVAGYEEAEGIASAGYLTNAQFEKYVESGDIKDVSEWSFNGKGWVNIENGMTDLVDAIRKNTEAIYYSDKADAQAKVDYYNNMMSNLDQSTPNLDRKIDVQNSLGASYVMTEAEYINSPLFGSDNYKVVEDTAKYLTQEGLDRGVWSYFFASEKEYNEWRELYNGGYEEALRYLELMKGVDPTKVVTEMNTGELDKQYNLYQLINEEQRKRNQLERKYEELLKDENATMEQIIENRNNRLTAVRDEKGYYDTLKTEKKTEIDNYLLGNEEFAKLITYKDGTIQLKSEAYDTLNSDQGKAFEEWLKGLEGLNDQYLEADEGLQNAADEEKAISEEGRDEQIEALNRIKEAIVSSRQKEIDALSQIDQSINDANSKLIQSIQDQLAAERQARQNDKTKEDIEEKQQRLLYLQQDSSGANAMEILKLQEEIDNAQEDFTDQLIDQKITELQKQNDKASEQRQRQIELLQAQLDQDVASGAIWTNVSKVWEEGFKDGKLVEGSELETMLKNNEEFQAMSEAEQKKWLEDMLVLFRSMALYETPHYSTGGLADFTGPAWLDGTKSRPEYVLNADQTEAFFKLLDVAGGIESSSSTGTQKSGDNSFDIDIIVESLGSDYDVEQLAAKIQEMIVNSSRYRTNAML